MTTEGSEYDDYIRRMVDNGISEADAKATASKSTFKNTGAKRKPAQAALPRLETNKANPDDDGEGDADSDIEIAAKAQAIIEAAKARYLDSDTNRSQLSLFQVATWHDDFRVLPNDLARSAIFSTRHKREPRRLCEDKIIFHLHNNVKITYTGVELRADSDELVWMQIIEYCKRAVVGSTVQFSMYQLCQDLGWTASSAYYTRITKCLKRLQATAVSIEADRFADEHDRLVSLSFIEKFVVRGRGECLVELSKELIALFAGQQFSKVVWDKYRKLTPTARRLFDYFASHRKPHPLTLENFKALCDSSSQSPNKWRQQSQKACEELVKAEMVSAAWIDGTQIRCERKFILEE